MDKFADMKILIYGAGSIGNHYANGFVERGHEVIVTDISEIALNRMKNDIYPERYGKWNNSIKLLNIKETMSISTVDVVFIGTPPPSHMSICTKAMEVHNPKIVHIEKPICTPDLNGLLEVVKYANKENIILLNGYNHNLTKNVIGSKKIIRDNDFGKPLILNSNVNEHWGGIFNAHPWIKNLKDTYLSSYQLGGGAMSEHSHGINLWQTFSNYLGMGRIDTVSSKLVFEKNDDYTYDSIMHLNVESENGLVGNITQDVVTTPHKKNLEIVFENGYINIINNYRTNLDRLEYHINGKTEKIDYPKTRKDDFTGAIENIENALLNNCNLEESMGFSIAIDTMCVINSSIESNKLNKRIKINYKYD